MSITTPSNITQTMSALFDPYVKAQRPIGYVNAELSSRHLNTIAVPYSSILKSQADQYWEHLRAEEEWSVDELAYAIQLLIETSPAAVDFAFDVDGGGYTCRKPTPCYSTEWLSLGGLLRSAYVRFSQARTANHIRGALRSPVMGGYALEITRQPSSSDPRDISTVLVYGRQQEDDARYPWVKPHSARVYDFTGYADKPYFVGPLYNGHPNEITELDALACVIAVSREFVLRILAA